MKKCFGRYQRASGYHRCTMQAVWALTTPIRAEWTFSCAQHLHQVLTGMADQTRVEVIRADRLVEGEPERLDVEALVREIVTTYPQEFREVWSTPLIRAEARDAGFPESTPGLDRESVGQTLKNLCDQGVLAEVGQVGTHVRYRLADDPNAHTG